MFVLGTNRTHLGNHSEGCSEYVRVVCVVLCPTFPLNATTKPRNHDPNHVVRLVPTSGSCACNLLVTLKSTCPVLSNMYTQIPEMPPFWPKKKKKSSYYDLAPASTRPQSIKSQQTKISTFITLYENFKSHSSVGLTSFIYQYNSVQCTALKRTVNLLLHS